MSSNESQDSQAWAAAIGLAKLKGDTHDIYFRFVQALNVLGNYRSLPESKLLAAEVMAATPDTPIQELADHLRGLEDVIRHQGNVPEELSVGTAAILLAGRRYDGTYPIDKFNAYMKVTKSYAAAAILAVQNVDIQELTTKFRSFTSLFQSWGAETSEDTEIASAYLAVSELGVTEVRDKLVIINDSLKNYLEYPLVASAILASIPVFEAHEVLSLVEKASALIRAADSNLKNSEVVSLAVRMIHGIRSETVKRLDSTAKVSNTPVQFTYQARPMFFPYYYWVFVAHSCYHSSYCAAGSFHAGHVHGVGGFSNG